MKNAKTTADYNKRRVGLSQMSWESFIYSSFCLDHLPSVIYSSPSNSFGTLLQVLPSPSDFISKVLHSKPTLFCSLPWSIHLVTSKPLSLSPFSLSLCLPHPLPPSFPLENKIHKCRKLPFAHAGVQYTETYLTIRGAEIFVCWKIVSELQNSFGVQEEHLLELRSSEGLETILNPRCYAVSEMQRSRKSCNREGNLWEALNQEEWQMAF